MQVLSINVGLPRDVLWRGQTITTSIFKEPVAGTLRVRRLNVDGDGQSDLTVHGGEEKAVYVYPSEHYAFWREELPGMDLPWGTFGENLTTTGLDESNVHIGDRLRIGSAEFVVTQPRMPCYKLGIRFGRPDIIKRFLESGRTGFYLAVTVEGDAAAGDAVSVTARHPDAIAVADVVSLYARDAGNQELLRRVSALAALPEDWRDYFRTRLWQSDEAERR
jgi:MOSC domain-containing protein YiiM